MWRRLLQLEPLFAASLALLIDQLRSGAPGPAVGASIGRLQAIARMGELRLEVEALRADAQHDSPTAVGAALLVDAMTMHHASVIEVHNSVTQEECLKLARALLAPPAFGGTTVDPVFRNTLWNVKVVTERPRHGAPTPRLFTAPAAGTALQQVAAAVQGGDAHQVVAALSAIIPDPVFRAAATPAALHLVAELVGDPAAEDPSAVLRIIDRAGEEGVRAVFQHLMASGDIAARRRYYDACLTLKAGTRVFMEYLNHQLWYVVRNAASLLGETNAETAVPALGRLLKHDEERVRLAAVAALGQIGGPDAIARLETALYDPSMDVRRRVMSILFTNQEHWSELDGSDPINDIERDEALRLEMVRALGRVNTQAAAHKLQTLVEGKGVDSSVELRLAAMDALAQGHRALAMQVLPKYAYDPFPTIRAKVAQLLR